MTSLSTQWKEMVPNLFTCFSVTNEALYIIDDMPAHVKCTMIGSSINVPITKGKFNLGTWQGILTRRCSSKALYFDNSVCVIDEGLYLCEHRNAGGYGGGHERKIVVTIQGTK